MNRKGWFVCIYLLLLLTGCQQGGVLKGPPPVTLPAQIALEEIQPVTVPLVDLAASPDEYSGQLLQLSGRFESRPILSCGSKFFSWPAWQMAEGETMVPASGPANLLSALQSAGSELIVEGYWRYRPDRLGCQDKAQIQALWYLAVVRIVSPNPIALLSPAGEGLSIPGELSTTSGAPDFFAATPGSAESIRPTPTEIGPVTASESDLPLTPDPTGLDQISPYPGSENLSPTATITRQLIASPTASDSGPDDLAPPSPSVTTPAPTIETPDARATQTPTVPGQETTTQPLLAAGSLETGALQASQSHRWPYEIESAQTITVQVAPDAELELTVSVTSANGQLVDRATQLSLGEPLILADVELLTEGSYEILVSTSDTTDGSYAILVTDEESNNFIFQGLLREGISATGDFEPNNDHFWVFSAQRGDSLRIEGSPDSDEDLFFRLFDPQGINIITHYNGSPAGQTEELVDYILPATGLYSLLVGEQNFGPANYSVVYFIE